MIVAKDGSGDFRTIQAAVNSLPKDSSDPVHIFVKAGVYKEKVVIDRPNLTLEGTARDKVLITYDDYALMKDENGKPIGTFATATVLFIGNDFTAKNIIFENSAGSGSIVGQAVAAYVDADQMTFENCSFLGHQDTLFLAPLPPNPLKGESFGGPRDELERKVSRSYFHNCDIEGDVDFIFGSGTALFEECNIVSLNRDADPNGYITAASTPENEPFGFVFYNCRLTSTAAADTVYLGRPWRDFAKTVFLNCWMDEHIKEEGWHNWGKSEAETTAIYAEVGSYGPGGHKENRVKWARQLTEEEVETDMMNEFINNQSKRARDNSESIKIFLAGDSTVEDVAEELGNHQGWGQQLPQFFSNDVNVINKAKGGRSTKSFIDEGRLLELEHALSKDDYLFIQFGHNDQKLEDPTRGTEPWGMYQTNLTLFIETARKQGAKPILITPVSRRHFADGELLRTLGEYPNAMKELATKLEVPLIDLLEKSRELYKELGEEKTKQLFAWYQRTGETTPPDNTHFSEYGAFKIAELVIEGIDELGLDLSDYIVGKE